MKIETLDDLFLTQLRELYDVERRLEKALPKLAKAASSERLREAFRDHFEQTKGHVRRLEEVFQDLGESPESKTAEGMKGLVEEGEHIISNLEQSPLRDAALIAAANRVEHYEIASYGTLLTVAYLLGHTRSADQMQRTLEEEKHADARLTEIAEHTVNQEALQLGAHQRV